MRRLSRPSVSLVAGCLACLAAFGCGGGGGGGTLRATWNENSLTLSSSTFTLVRGQRSQVRFQVDTAVPSGPEGATTFDVDNPPSWLDWSPFQLGVATEKVGASRGDPASKVQFESRKLPNGVVVFEVKLEATAPTELLAWRINLETTGEAVYGGGPSTEASSLVGRSESGFLRRQGESVDGATSNDHVPVPFFVRRDGLAFFFDTRAPWRFDHSRATKLAATVRDTKVSFTVINAASPREALEAFALLTAKPVVPPTWALAPIAAASGADAASLLAAATQLRSADVPAGSVLLRLPWMTASSTYLFNEVNVPNVTDTVSKLGEQGFRLMVEATPRLNTSDDSAKRPGQTNENLPLIEQATRDGLLVKVGDAPYTFDWSEGTAALPDLTVDAGRKLLGNLVKRAVGQGVDGFYARHGEEFALGASGAAPASWLFGDKTPADSMGQRYADLEHLTLLEAYASVKPSGEPLVLARGAGFGGQAFTHAVVADSTTATWGAQGLRAAYFATITSGLSGFPALAVPVGGSSGTPDEELVARWAELASASPLFLLTGGRSLEQLVGTTAPETQRLALATAAKHHLTLLPYRRNVLDAAAASGTPPIVPLSAAFPDDDTLANVDDEYLFGPDIIVAPVLLQGEQNRIARVPAGTRWNEYWTGSRVFDTQPLPGGRGKVPMLLRKGAVVPLLPDGPRTASGVASGRVVDLAETKGTARFVVAVGGEGSATDPISGATATLTLPATLKVEDAREEIRVEVLDADRTQGASDEDGPIPMRESPADLASCDRCQAPETATGRLFVKIAGRKTTLTFLPNP